MTEINHRRQTRQKVLGSAHGVIRAGNGDFRGWNHMHGKQTTGRDYAFAEAGAKSTFSDNSVHSKPIGNDFTNGRRGMAKALRGAKKFVRSRIRFHDNAETKKMALQCDE